MRTKYLLIILTVLIASCSSRIDKSDAYGNFEATAIIVSSESNGKILELNIDEGQIIKANQIVGIIDTIDLSLKKQQLADQKRAVASRLVSISSQIEVQQQQKKNLLVNRDRIKKLFEDGAATQKQMDDMNGSIDLVNKQIISINTQKQGINDEIQAIGKQIAQVEEAIKKCYIINPVNGTILTKYAEQDEVTMFGKPIYKIANLDEMKLKVYISGSQLPQIKLGQRVEVLIDKDATTHTKLNGTICWISQTAEFTPKIIQTKKERVNLVYAVKVRVKNNGTLKIGMPGEVNFKY